MCTKLDSVALLLLCYWASGGHQLALTGSAKYSCSQDHGGCLLPCYCRRIVDKVPDVPVGDAWVAGLVRMGYETEGQLGIWCSLHQVCLEDA